MKRLALALVCCSVLPLAAQDPTDAVGKGEFPGLQLLPPGSEIKGITLPRYEQHRVTSLLQAASMKVLTRRTVELKGIDASLYTDANTVTRLRTSGAVYNFTTLRAATDGPVSVEDPRFTAEGSGVVFSTENRRGIVKGPVRTTIAAAMLNNSPAKPAKPAPAAEPQAATPAEQEVKP